MNSNTCKYSTRFDWGMALLSNRKRRESFLRKERGGPLRNWQVKAWRKRNLYSPSNTFFGRLLEGISSDHERNLGVPRAPQQRTKRRRRRWWRRPMFFANSCTNEILWHSNPFGSEWHIKMVFQHRQWLKSAGGVFEEYIRGGSRWMSWGNVEWPVLVLLILIAASCLR